MSLRLAAALCCLALAPSLAHAEVLIIDVSQKKKAVAQALPDLHVLMSDSDMARSLSAGTVAQLKSIGYTLTAEVDYGRVKEGRNARALLRLEIVHLDQSCFVNVYSADFKTPENSTFRWETKDDAKPCADSIKLGLEAFAAAHRPSSAPPPGLDAGVPDSGPVPPDAAAPPPAKFHLAPVMVGGPEAPDAAAPAAPPAAKKGCGCQGGAGPVGLAALALALGLRRSRRRG
jgi:hypothetical protein